MYACDAPTVDSHTYVNEMVMSNYTGVSIKKTIVSYPLYNDGSNAVDPANYATYTFYYNCTTVVSNGVSNAVWSAHY
jgi:hypothetical protein